mgnify:CR=1 FL=1
MKEKSDIKHSRLANLLFFSIVIIISAFLSKALHVDEDTVKDKQLSVIKRLEREYHESVDLGLSVKWATCNVGANSPEEFGGYYRWGAIDEGDCKPLFIQSRKYRYNISGSQYDVARIKWGGSWRVPTRYEIQELVEKCTQKWTTYNGVNGALVTGPNGNRIFLPAAGYLRMSHSIMQEDRLEKYRDDYGAYWSATSTWQGNGRPSYSAHTLNFEIFSSNFRFEELSYMSQFRACPVRPVCDYD